MQQGQGAPNLGNALGTMVVMQTKLMHTLTKVDVCINKWLIMIHLFLGSHHSHTRSFPKFKCDQEAAKECLITAP